MFLKKLKKNFCYTAYTWTTSHLTGSGTKTLSKLSSLPNKVKKMSISDNHFAIITNENSLYTWGDNSHGQLGLKDKNNKKVSKAEEPTKVQYFEDKNVKLTDVVLGRKHTIALSDKGRVFTWGRGKGNSNAGSKILYPATLALGHKEPKDLITPKPVKAFRYDRIEQVSSGNDFAMAVNKKNSLWVWGRGEFGVLGGSNDSQREPILNVFIEEMKKTCGRILKIDSCSDFSSVLFENGKIFSFGNNDYGNLGIGFSQSVDTCDVYSFPTEIEFGSDQEPVLFKDVCLAEQASAYLTREGKVYFTGRKVNYYPKLFEIDYDKHKVLDFTAFDRGVAVLTEENRIFYYGNYWNGKYLHEDKETGIREVDVLTAFEGKIVKKLGGKYSIKYALVSDN